MSNATEKIDTDLKDQTDDITDTTTTDNTNGNPTTIDEVREELVPHLETYEKDMIPT